LSQIFLIILIFFLINSLF